MKYGLDKGLKIWEERQDKWQKTLNNKTEEEINLINSKKSLSLASFIRKYGNEIGLERWNDFRESCIKSHTLERYVERYGNEIGEKIFLNYRSFESMKEYKIVKDTKYRKNFHKMSLKMREKYNNTCQVCGVIKEKNKIHTHHIDFNKTNSIEENLIVLCSKCHKKAHHYFQLTKEELLEIKRKKLI